MGCLARSMADEAVVVVQAQEGRTIHQPLERALQQRHWLLLDLESPTLVASRPNRNRHTALCRRGSVLEEGCHLCRSTYLASDLMMRRPNICLDSESSRRTWRTTSMVQHQAIVEMREHSRSSRVVSGRLGEQARRARATCEHCCQSW
jgi:hypothetical protein